MSSKCMNFQKRNIVVAGIVVLGISSLATQARAEPLRLGIALVQPESSTASQDNAAALSRKVGEVEVERALQLAQFFEYTPVIQRLDEQYTALMMQLRQIEPSNYQILASSATQAALRAKIAELQTIQQQQSQVFTSDTPMQQLLQTQLSSLRQRLAEVAQGSS